MTPHMTDDQAFEQLSKIIEAAHGDTEAEHGDCDEFAFGLLESLGYTKTVALLNSRHWWYA